MQHAAASSDVHAVVCQSGNYFLYAGGPAKPARRLRCLAERSTLRGGGGTIRKRCACLGRPMFQSQDWLRQRGLPGPLPAPRLQGNQQSGGVQGGYARVDSTGRRTGAAITDMAVHGTDIV